MGRLCRLVLVTLLLLPACRSSRAVRLAGEQWDANERQWQSDARVEELSERDLANLDFRPPLGDAPYRELRAYAADFDDDGRDDILVYRELLEATVPGAGGTPAASPTVDLYGATSPRTYSRTGGFTLAAKLVEGDVARCMVGNLDDDQQLELIIWVRGGRRRNENLHVYEWTARGFSGISLGSPKWIEMNDIDGDGIPEFISWSYLDSSLSGQPSPSAIVLWPTIYRYDGAHLLRVSARFPEYYRQLRSSSIDVLLSIENGTADEFIMQHRGYFSRTHREIVYRCENILE